ncbi:hypothetical protein EDD11_003416 [Mortierella claussenii]|nr:hypothetical protein EDD11_003416 [Mortierella claussenii]
MLVNLLSVVTVAVALSSAPYIAAAPVQGCKPVAIENIAVFGDSYSDTGNVYKLSNNTWPLPSYYHGRFSNGPIWVDHVTSAKHYKLHNYAYGAATSDNNLVQGYSGADSKLPVPGFIQQIETLYAPKSTPKDADRTLFIVNFQGNDFFFDPTINPVKVVERIHAGISQLVSLGARNILLVENIDIGKLPYFNTNATVAAAYSAIAKQELAAFKALEHTLNQQYGKAKGPHPFHACEDSANSKVNVGYFKLGELFAELSQPKQLERLGITDIVHGCVSNDYKTVCKDAENYFYWDAFHPTRKIHQEIASAILHWL